MWEEENNLNDQERSIRKSKNYFDLGPIYEGLAKKGGKDGILPSILMTELERKFKFKFTPSSKLIKDVYQDLLKQ